MILPNDDTCRRVIDELKDEPTLTEWEYEFVSSNVNRTEFSDAQRQVIARLLEKFDA